MDKIQYTKTSIILEDDILFVENFTEKLKLIYEVFIIVFII